MTLSTGSRHLGDDDLIGYMDHQLDREAMRLGGVHLRTCAECAARLEGLRQKSAAAAEWLSLLGAGAPDPARRAAAQAAMERARFRRPFATPLGPAWMKAAAAIVLMVGVGLATEPGRALVADGIVRASGRDPGPAATRMLEWLGERRRLDPVALAPSRTAPPPPPAQSAAAAPVADRAEAPAPPASPVKPGTSAPVRFRPVGPDVSLTFAAVQPRGSAQLWIREAAPQASVQATSRYHGEELVTGPAGLEVRNNDRSRADYTIVIPARYRYINVRVGDGPVVSIQVLKSKREWFWTIPLQSSAVEHPEP
ncbi:MAG TPA: hypothetical protein VGO40_04425 [Longimicrobium sp.]|jgi:hypothetical protein|nr:hypothetical protein [Longimicrobium sp.]